MEIYNNKKSFYFWVFVDAHICLYLDPARDYLAASASSTV